MMYKLDNVFIFLIIISSTFIIQCNLPMENLPEGANRLYLESSPYLQQHAYNPVDWFPWGEEALKRAEQENKMLLISIGYAACHWCHVMEHESFEDEEVANLMNDHFICVKVDREERPDIDDVYMTACQLSSGGNCGWPLNSFALPDGRPVWAGTYFPKENWMNILKQMHEMYQKDLARLQRAAESITEGISNFGAIEPVEAPGTFRFQEQVQITEAFLRNIDFSEGGPRRAPKFPMPNNYEYLLKWYAYSGDVRALKAVTLTLDKMSAGGIYDHLGGGFARYSVDSFWKVPHFEKMLYDNGQLLGLYADAYRLTRKENWLEVVRKTYRYLVREHLDSSGGLYSSYDADSEGEEGTYYIWSAKEMKQLLGQDYEIAADYYQVTEDGNWEGKNILHLAPSLDEVLSKHNLSAEDFKMKIKAINTILFKAREKREKPGLDDKILSSWNGLALEGLCKAYLATSDREILDTALKVASFLTETMMVEGGKLCRNYKDGKRSINGFLDDYANVISGLIELYQVTFEPKWLDKAYLLQQYVDRHFFNERDQMYAYTSDEDPPLVASTKNYSDNVIPAANSVTARNLFALGTYYASPEFLERAQQMISNIQPLLQRSSQPDFYSNWLQLYLYQVNAPYEVAILGPDACEIRMKMAQHYLPNIYFLGGQEEHLPLLEHKLVEGENMIYVCKNKVCKLPVKSVEKALIQVQE